VRRRLLIALVAALCACGPAAAATGKASGDPLQGQEWWLAKIGADQVVPPGPGVPITLVDSGVDPTHPEFAGRPNTSFLNDQTVTGPGAEFHGTAVASIAAAPANGLGIVGVYPQAVLQSWDTSPVSDVVAAIAIEGISTAAQHCPGVINLSFGGSDPNPPLEEAILGAVHNGCLVVATAGNDGLKGNLQTYPASYPHVLTVGATDENDAVAPFSSLSPFVDLAAPGVDIVAAVPLSRDPSGYVSGLMGTSFAAPMVSAAAAWVWTARPSLDSGQVAELLRRTARDIGPPGRDSGSGFGVVNIPAALAGPAPPKDPSEPNDDINQVKPGDLFAAGEPALTTATKPSNRIAASLDSSEDPRDVYRIWVPAHRVVRAQIVSGGGDAAVRIWGPRTLGVDEGILPRRRDLKGPLIRGANKGFEAYAEVLLTGRTNAASYVLSVTASRR
jgi:Subtilase family